MRHKQCINLFAPHITTKQCIYLYEYHSTIFYFSTSRRRKDIGTICWSNTGIARQN